MQLSTPCNALQYTKKSDGRNKYQQVESFFHKTNTIHISRVLNYSGFFLFKGLDCREARISLHSPTFYGTLLNTQSLTNSKRQHVRKCPENVTLLSLWLLCPKDVKFVTIFKKNTDDTSNGNMPFHISHSTHCKSFSIS